MNQLLSIDRRFARKLLCVAVAAVLTLAVSPLLILQSAGAAQLLNRSITLSDASPSGQAGFATTGVGSGVNVTYRVTFTPKNTTNAQSMVIDFCQENPIIGDTACTRPVGMTYATGVSNVNGQVGGTGWTVTGTNGQIKLAGDASHAMQQNIPQTFDLTGITNPSEATVGGSSRPAGTFYARMYTYANNSWGSYTGPGPASTSPGNYLDFGGIALSTSNTIQITARVQESLMFCVTKAAYSSWSGSHDCTDPVVGNAANYPALILGQGTPTAVLDANRVDTGTVYSQVSTNATTGVSIRMRNSNTLCGGLSADNGTTCAIPAQAGSGNTGASNTASAVMAAGKASFGMFASDGTIDTTNGGLGSTTANSSYHDTAVGSTHNDPTSPSTLWYGMNNDATTGVTSTFGSMVASSTAPVYRVNNTYVFAATPALTTPAGIYTANLSMIATGNF